MVHAKAGHDWKRLHQGIAEYFKPRTLPVAFKYYDSAEEMLSNQGLSLSKAVCTPCLAVAKAVYAGECVCITADNLNTDYCRAVNNLREKDEKWYSGAPFLDRWNSNLEAAQAHQKAIPTREKLYGGFAVAPLERGVIEDPDGCLLYVTPEQAFWILVSSQNEEYKVHEFTFVGESTCSDSLLTTAIKGKTALGIGSNGERTVGALPHTELILTITLDDLEKALSGAEKMRKGREYLSHPVLPYATCADISCTPNPHFKGY